MRRLVVFVFLVVGVAGGGYAQLREMPEAVREFLENYTKDSTTARRIQAFKRMGVIPDSIEIKDLRLRAIEVYSIGSASLDAYPDTVPLSEIIKPSGLWHVLVLAYNNPLYQLELRYNGTEKPHSSAGSFPPPGSSFKDPMWLSLLEMYPEPTVINPVLITVSGYNTRPSMRGGANNILYFKEKGPRKVHFIKSRWSDDTLNSLFSGSITNLDDSRELVRHLKTRDLNQRATRSDEHNRREPNRSISPVSQDVNSGSFGVQINHMEQQNNDSQNLTAPTLGGGL